MAPRANWKGLLRIAELSCPVALFTAASSSDRIAFHTINRATGNRVHRQFVDSDTGKLVEKEDQIKGYEVSKDEYVVLQPEEIAAAIPDSDKTLNVSAFIDCNDIDDIYFDKPYFLAPADNDAREVFALIRDGLAQKNVAAIAQTVLFRRMRSVLIRAHNSGLVATTLNFDYEVRSPAEAFKDIATLDISSEMLDLAKHIIKTKKGKFNPAKFEDRYESALADLVKAKLEGKKILPVPAPESTKVVDLMEALRASATGKGGRAAGNASAKGKSDGKTFKASRVADKPRPRSSAKKKLAAPRGATARRKAG